MFHSHLQYLKQSSASAGVQLPRWKVTFQSELRLRNAFSFWLYLFCCSSCTFVCCKWKWSEIKSMVITTSSHLECNYTVTLSGRWLRGRSIRLCSEWNGTDWLIYVCQVKGKETDKKKPQSVRVGQAWGGSPRSMDEAWTPDGGRRVLNQTETNGVWETERKKFRHTPADLNPFFPPTNQYREMHVWGCVSVYVCVLVLEGGRFLSVSLPIKIRNTVTLPQPGLTPLWPSNPCTCLYLILEPVIQ